MKKKKQFYRNFAQTFGEESFGLLFEEAKSIGLEEVRSHTRTRKWLDNETGNIYMSHENGYVRVRTFSNDIPYQLNDVNHKKRIMILCPAERLGLIIDRAISYRKYFLKKESSELFNNSMK